MVQFRWLLLCVLIVSTGHGSTYAQYGAQLTGVGAINRSMGGTSTAAPLDTLGALLWNPATITELPNSTDFGLELLVPQTTLSSTVNGVSGSTHSGAGAFPLPNWGVVFRPNDSPYTYGFGILTVAGFGVNYAGDASNPILRPYAQGGFGSVYSQYAQMQVVQTLAIKVTDQLSIGISPIVDMASLSLDPGFVSAPTQNIFPPMTAGQYQWGLGIQAGAYYKTDNDWQFGASIKSPQWFNHFSYNSKDPAGNAEFLKTATNAPMIVSIGTAYTGLDRLLIAFDARYLDYQNTVPFSQSGFTSTGAVAGLGWNSIFALSTGVQYKMSEATSLRAGYSFSTNPINSDHVSSNIASPLVIQHGIYVGNSYNVTKNFKLSLAYSHFFENSVSGPIVTPDGPIPGASVSSKTGADALTAGASFLF